VIKSLRLPKSLVKQELPIMNGVFCPMIRSVLSWICNVGANVWLWSAMVLTIHRHWHGPMWVWLWEREPMWLWI
jgi:ATPase-IB_hvy: heavy metal translocating P-type ATPase